MFCFYVAETKNKAGNNKQHTGPHERKQTLDLHRKVSLFLYEDKTAQPNL